MTDNKRPSQTTDEGAEGAGHIQLIEMEAIIPPKKAMRMNIDYDKIISLAESIKEIGLINPITVIQEGEHYRLIAGDRRYKAYQHLGKSLIPAIVFPADTEKNRAMMISENIHREDVPVCEEAQALKDMKDDYKLTGAQLARLIGKAESYVSERLAILSYPPGLYFALADGKISFSVACELARLDDPDILKVYTETAMNAGATPRLVRQWVKDWQMATDGKDTAPIERISDSGGSTGRNPEMTTGCHICTQTVPLTNIRHLNVCADCWDSVFKSLMSGNEG